MTRRHFLILFALAFLARLPLLWTPFWYDENYTLILARLPFAQMLQATAGDVHPPLWYIIEWLIFRLPVSPVALRIPALLISMAALVVFRAMLDNFLLSNRVRSAALVIMAFAPMQVYYASEGRMYSFLCFLVLAGVLAAQKRQWGWLCLISTALAYTHNFGLFYAVGLWLFTLLYWREWIINTIPFVCSAVLWLPWVSVLFHQMDMIRQSYWIVRVDAGLVLYQIYQQVWAMALPHPASIVVTFAALLLGVWRLRRHVYILTLAFAPLLMAVVVSLLWQPVLLYRAVIGTSPFIYILLASLMTHITTRRRALIALIFVAPMLLMATVNLYYGGLTHAYRDGSQDYLKVIEANYQPGDILAATSDTFIVNSMPYADITLPVVMVKECKPALGALTNETRHAMGYDIRPWNEITGRVWLIGGASPLVYQCEGDFYKTVTAGLTPVLDMPSVDGLIHTSMWLIEKK
jgi:uncharacterized membrane protein